MAAFRVSERTASDLGWERIRAALAERTETDCGRERALALPFLDEEAAAERSFARIEEARGLLRREMHIPVAGAEDVRAALGRAAREAVLEASEVLACARLIRAAVSARRSLRAHRDDAVLLAEMGAGLVDLSDLAAEYEACIEPCGRLKDTASRELQRYRSQARRLHRQLKEHVEGLLDEPSFAEMLQDRFYSVRGDRYVLPVRSSFRAQVPGIIHNASQTGQTVFVEPEQLVPMGNELAIAESLAAEEERRILASFSADLSEARQELLRSLDILAALDVVQAAARLAQAMDAVVPELVRPHAGFDLRGMRHPLLVLQGQPVVKNTVTLGPDQFGMIVSGPNAGGKTVTITGVGLCHLLARAGLLVSAEQGSSMPLVNGVSCTIGDAQDIASSLSSFSGHLGQLKEIMAMACKGSLVLIDEIASGTDPQEGAALAQAVLRKLADQRVRTLVTTHIDEIKALGVTDARFVNARVGYDPATLAVTYRLELGAAGVSNAIEMAAQMGLPADVLDEARSYLRRSNLLSDALEKLEATRRQLAVEGQRVAAEHAALAKARQEADEARAALDAARRDAQSAVRQELAAEVQRARQEIGALIAELQAAPSMRKAQQVQRTLADKGAELAQQQARLVVEGEVAATASSGVGALERGARVKVVSLDAEGEILDLHGDEALVALGTLRSRIAKDDLVVLPGRGQRRKRNRGPNLSAGSQRAAGGVVLVAAPLEHPACRCDVRGLRADEALRQLEHLLDRSYAEGPSLVLVVHGHGTGALKQVVREALGRSPYVDSFRPGERHEGGDGVTVITLRQ